MKISLTVWLRDEVGVPCMLLVKFLGGENINEIAGESVCKLIRSSGVGAIRINEVRDFVFPVSFGNGMMEERSVPVTCNCPIFLCSLDMVGLFFSHQILVLAM